MMITTRHSEPVAELSSRGPEAGTRKSWVLRPRQGTDFNSTCERHLGLDRNICRTFSKVMMMAMRREGQGGEER